MVRRHEPHGDQLEEDAAVPDEVRHKEEYVILLLALGGLLVLGGRGHGCGIFGTLSGCHTRIDGKFGQSLLGEKFLCGVRRSQLIFS